MPLDRSGSPVKRTRSIRSCLNCRKAKQRCHLPDVYVEPSTSCALPRLQSCSRCNSLNLSCFVVTDLPKSAQRSLRRRQEDRSIHTPGGASHVGTSPRDARRSRGRDSRSPPVSVARTYPDEASYGSNSSGGGDAHRRHSTHRGRSITPPAGDFRMLDPLSSLKGGSHDTQEHPSEDRQRPPRAPSAPSIQQNKSGKNWIDIGVTDCRPFQLLDHLLLRYNLLPPRIQAPAAAPALEAVEDLREGYETIAENIRGTILFLPSFDDARADSAESDLLLCAVLCLSWESRLEEEGQRETLSHLRQRCLACVLHSTHNLYDVYAILVVALHLPLLFGPRSNSYGLDGLGLLSAAISAARLMDLDKTAQSIGHSYDLEGGYAAHLDAPRGMISDACLWVSLCLHAEYVALAGSGKGRPLATCSRHDLQALQEYSDALLHAREVPADKKRCGVHISLFVFRARAVSETRELVPPYAEAMDSAIGRGDLAGLEDVAKAANVASRDSYDRLKKEGHRLASEFALCGWTNEGGSFGDFTLNLVNLQLLYFSRLAEKLIGNSATIAGPCDSPADLLKQLSSNSSLMQTYALICGQRADVAKHFLALFINTCRRRRAHRGGGRYVELSSTRRLETHNWSVPFVHLCSSIIMAADSVVEEVAGRVVIGSSRHKSVRDDIMETGEVVLSNVYDCLSAMSKGTTAPGQARPRARQAILDGNFPVVAAELIDMLLRTLEGWNAAMTPLLLANPIAGTSTSASTTDQRHAHPGGDDMDLQLDKLTPEGLENLFREFLSTPLELFPPSSSLE